MENENENIKENIDEENEQVQGSEQEISGGTEAQASELTPTIDELNKALQDALVENATLKQRLETVTRERDEAQEVFLSTGRQSEEKQRNYNDILGDIR